MEFMANALTHWQISLYYLWLLERMPEQNVLDAYLAAHITRNCSGLFGGYAGAGVRTTWDFLVDDGLEM